MDGLLVRDPDKAEGIRHLPFNSYAKSLIGNPSSYASINWVRFKGSLHGVIRSQPLSLFTRDSPDFYLVVIEASLRVKYQYRTVTAYGTPIHLSSFLLTPRLSEVLPCGRLFR